MEFLDIYKKGTIDGSDIPQATVFWHTFEYRSDMNASYESWTVKHDDKEYGVLSTISTFVT